jgi:hypothetical protein
MKIRKRTWHLGLALSLSFAAVFAVLAAADARAGLRKDLVFAVSDPYGDDFGAGELRYPLDSDFERGTLDLLKLEALAVEGGTLLRFLFAEEIEHPGQEVVDGVGTARAERARLGFYHMNVDVYVDTDRRPGMGEVGMLPGRKAEVAPTTAWEKVIAITPRPDALRASIHRLRVREWREEEEKKRTVSRREVKKRKKQIVEELLPLVYFPNRVRVLGRRLEVFVPEEFLGGVARADWAYTVVVTGARLEERLSLPLFGKYSQESYDGLVLPVVPGSDREAFGGGREGDPLQPPIVDVLVPPGASPNQNEILSRYDSYQERPAQVPGVVPAEQ